MSNVFNLADYKNDQRPKEADKAPAFQPELDVFLSFNGQVQKFNSSIAQSLTRYLIGQLGQSLDSKVATAFYLAKTPADKVAEALDITPEKVEERLMVFDSLLMRTYQTLISEAEDSWLAAFESHNDVQFLPQES